MRQIYLDYLAQTRDEKRLSYDDLVPRTNMSKSKLQRIFTGQTEPTVSDLEIIVEKGLKGRIEDLYAKIGEQELKDSEELDYKGARALLDDFNAEKKQIRTEYQTRIDQLVSSNDERQKAFTLALDQIGAQYKKNADYLTGIIKDNENYIRDLLEQTERANMIAAEAQKRAQESEKKISTLEKRLVQSEKRRYKVFWTMLALVVILLTLLVLGVILDLPLIGMGNG